MWQMDQSDGVRCSRIPRARGTRMQQPHDNHLWTEPLGEEFISIDLQKQAPRKRGRHVSRHVGNVQLNGVNSAPKSVAIASRMLDGTARRVSPPGLAFAKATKQHGQSWRTTTRCAYALAGLVTTRGA